MIDLLVECFIFSTSNITLNLTTASDKWNSFGVILEEHERVEKSFARVASVLFARGSVGVFQGVERIRSRCSSSVEWK